MYPARSLASHGFTLLEILVVMVIIGIVLSIATVAVSVLGSDRQTEDESRRFWFVLRQAREEAELQSVDLGMFVARTGYEYLRYDHRRTVWLPIYGDRLLAQRELPEGLHLRLWLESREIVMKPDPVQRDSKEAEKWPPQVMVLSSGDTTPFELHIERDGAPALWRIVATAENDLRLERRESDFAQWQVVAQTREVRDELEAS